MLHKAKPRLKCKGYNLVSRKDSLDTEYSNNFSRFGKALVHGIPVLSIFAFLGIFVFGISFTSLLSTQKVYAKCEPGHITDPTTGVCISPSNPVCSTGYLWDPVGQRCVETGTSAPSVSMSIDNNVIKDNITAVRGNTAYASHTIHVEANNISGYALTITGPAALTAPNGSAATSSNVTNWGYGWGSTSTADASLAYTSFTGNAQKLTGDAVANSSVNFDRKLAFRANFTDNAAEGHYTASVNLGLTVTPKQLTLSDLTYMQQMYTSSNSLSANTTGVSSICAASATGETATLTDSRDNSTYTVKKLANGQCWMTQNLRIVNKTISSTDSDMTSGSFNIPAPSTSGFSASNTANVYYPNNTTYGAYYTWYAATAGVGTNSVSSGDVSTSICPKGWKLPKSGTTTYVAASFKQSAGMNDFAAAVNYTGANLSSTPNVYSTIGASFASNALTANGLTWSAAGYYSNSAPNNVGANGSYWSRTARDGSSAYNFYLHSGGTYPVSDGSKSLGSSVRCVAYSN